MIDLTADRFRRYHCVRKTMATLPASPVDPLLPDPPAGGETAAPGTPAFSPLYQQIKTLILRSLQAGEWKPGDMIPSEFDLAARFRVSMPASIEGFVRQQVPEARRIELCYTATQVVIHRGWTPIASGCQPGPGDEVIALTGAGRTMAATTNGDLQ